ncbi:MAG: hypothetical protein AB1397_08400 [bacterium]
MVVNAIEPNQGYVSEMPKEVNEIASASVRAEMPQAETRDSFRSPMPVSDAVEPDPAMSVYTSQIYQQQQAYFDTARRIEIGAVGIGGQDHGTLPPPFEVSLLRPAETLISLSKDGWRGILPYNPYIYHNFMWKQPQEQISIVW